MGRAPCCASSGGGSAGLLEFVPHKLRLYLSGDSYLLKPLGQHNPRENVPPVRDLKVPRDLANPKCDLSG